MLFAGALFSAVAILLGIFTKLPQGGGGLINNLVVLSCFYSAPPLLHPPPPPRAYLFDLDPSFFETRQYYVRDLQSTGNVTEGPMPNPLTQPRDAPGSQNTPAPNSNFSLPGFSFPAFSLPFDFYQLCVIIGETVARVAMVFFALCLPWLTARYLLEMTVSARKAAGTPRIVASEFEQEFWQIQPHNPLLDDLKIVISEHDQALIELRRIKKKAKKEGKKALERNNEDAEIIKGLRKEREDLLVELAEGERSLGVLQKEKEDEVEVLKKEAMKQARALEEKEKEWVEKEAGDDKRNQEEKHSLKIGRERERDSWKKQVERLRTEKEREMEGMGMKLKDVTEEMEKERERWAKEREGWQKKKEAIEAGRKKSEEESNREKKSWKEANDCAKRRIVELEDENIRLTNEAAQKEKLNDEREAERKAFEEARAEKLRLREEEVQAEAKKATSKLEEEVLNGRKLIEDLQSDKRRDRQLLLELRAQLVRPTHAVPPNHINPLRFGGSAQAAYGWPILATSPAAPSPAAPSPAASSPAAPSASSPASPRGALPTILSINPPQATQPTTASADAVNQDVGWLFAPLPSGPMVRLPPPPASGEQTAPRRIPAPSLAPPNAPKGPKGWRPGPPRGT